MANEATIISSKFYGVTYRPSFMEDGNTVVVAAFISRSDAAEYVEKWDGIMGTNGKHSIVKMTLSGEVNNG